MAISMFLVIATFGLSLAITGVSNSTLGETLPNSVYASKRVDNTVDDS